MRLAWALSGLVIIGGLAGCEKKDQDAALDQGRVVVSRAADLATGAWKSALAQASKLSADSAKPALESAKAQLERAKSKLSEIKMPSGLDHLKLASIQEELSRLEAALNVQKLKSEMDERVDAAMKTKENAEKTIGEVRQTLAKADAEYQDMQKKLKDAQEAYESASAKVKETSQKIQSL
jgi:chromosome segregation ATPase